MDHETIERENVVERYVAGKLDAADAAEFEEHYLDCERCAEAVEDVERLQRGLKRVAQEETVQTLRKGFLVTLLASARVRAGLLLLTLVALLLPFVWQQRQVARLRTDLQAAHTELDAVRGGDPAQIAALRQEIEETRQTLEAAQSRWTVDLEAAKTESTRLAAQLTAALAPRGNARIFSFSPFRDVGIGETPHHEIDLPAGDAWVVLSLDAGGGEATTYRAILRRDDEVVWRSGDLEPDEIGSIVVSFPPGFLEAGAYRLDVVATATEGTVARYPLRVSTL